MTLYVTKLQVILDFYYYEHKEYDIDLLNRSEFKIEIKDESMEHTYYHRIKENVNTNVSFDMQKFSKISSILSSTKLNDDRLKIYPYGELDFQSIFPELSFDRIEHLSVSIYCPYQKSKHIRLLAPFKTLKRLELNGSINIDFTLCTDIMEMKDLNKLYLSSVLGLNKFPEFFENLENLKNLRSLTLAFQTFNIDIMKSIYKCSSLVDLDLSNLNLPYPIDKRIHDLVSLDKLALSRVLVSNEVLTYIGKLSKLKFLELWQNNLSCELPTSLDFLSELEHLEICQNEIKGPIPKCLGNMIKLKHLDLWGNKLSGIIPDELKNLVNLKYFRLAENFFAIQNIPYIFSGMKDLEHVDLMLAFLTGYIEDQFINNTKLKVFYIMGNEIEDIPDYIKNIKGIDITV